MKLFGDVGLSDFLILRQWKRSTAVTPHTYWSLSLNHLNPGYNLQGCEAVLIGKYVVDVSEIVSAPIIQWWHMAPC
jgi:hypothetical protein